MNMNDILTAITTVGFPICMCGGMAWYVKYITDKNREQIDKITEQHKNEMETVTTAVNNNTVAIQHLSDLIGATKT